MGQLRLSSPILPVPEETHKLQDLVMFKCE